MLVALLLRRVPHRADKGRIERCRGKIPKFLDFDIETDRPGDRDASFPQLAIHYAQHRVLGMPEIDSKEYAAGDRVARVRTDLDKADRRASVGGTRMRDPADGADHAGGADQRIAPPGHRRRT